MPDLETVISGAIASSGLSSESSSSDSGSGDTSAADSSSDSGETPIGGDSADSGTETPAGDTGTATPAATPAPATPAADAPVAAEAPATKEETLEQLQQELAGKRDNRIPYSRVTRIVENATKKAEAAAAAKYAKYETPEFKNGQTAMDVADKSPDKFLQTLAEIDPRYADLLAGSKALGGTPAAATAGRQAQQPAADADVHPDIELGDGTLGYSADATAKLLARERATLTAEFKKELDERLAGLKPIQDEYRTNKVREEAADTVAGRIAAAESWPGFSDHKNEIAETIMAATKRGERLDLHEAYIRTVYPKLNQRAQDAEKTARAKVIEEMNKAAKGSSGVAPGAVAAANTKPAIVTEHVDPIEAAIRASVAGIKR